MSGELIARAGSAMAWRAAQLAGVEGIYFVRLMILAMLLAPEAFGLLAVAVAAVGIMMRLSDVGMIPALIQRKDATTEEYDGAWTVGLLRALVVAALLAVLAPLIARGFGAPEATAVIQVLALRPVLEASSSIGIARLTRSLQFRELAMLRLPGALVDLAVAVAIATSWGVWALVAGALCGAATTAVFSYGFAPHRPRFVLRPEVIRPLVRFGRWIMGTGIVVLIGTTALQVTVSRLHGAAALGTYFLASKIAFLPVEVSSKIVGSVAFPLFAHSGGDSRRDAGLFGRLFGSQAIMLLPVYAIMFVLAPSLESAFGERWSGTAPVIQILAVACVTGLLGEVLGPLFMGRGRPDFAFLLEAVQTSLIVLAVWPLVSRYGSSGAALAWLIGNLAALGVGLGRLPVVLSRESWLERPWLVVSIVAALAATPVAIFLDDFAGGFTGIVLAAAAGLLVASGVVIATERFLGLGLTEFARSLGWLKGRAA